MINLYNEDCLEAMKRMDDNSYDLAVVDPPYGILNIGIKITKPSRPNSYIDEPKHAKKNWDNKTPSKEYFDQLIRVSKNQIIFGGNYFTDKLPVSKSWIFWDKINGIGSHFADGELIWTSFGKSTKKFVCSSHHGTNGGKNRIHPTQKPVKLYTWILNNYAKEGDKILDTHLGSGSIAIACHNLGFDLDGYELDTDYYEAASKRLKEHQRQLRLF